MVKERVFLSIQARTNRSDEAPVKSPILRRVTILLLAVAASSACSSRVADYSERFHLRGKLSKPSGEGVPDAEVVFTDTGLDQWKSPNQFVVTRTRDDGSFDVSFDYSWGREEGKKMPDTIEVEFRKGNTGLATRQFVRSALPRDEGALLVEVIITCGNVTE